MAHQLWLSQEDPSSCHTALAATQPCMESCNLHRPVPWDVPIPITTSAATCALQHEVHGSACSTTNAISPRAIEANPLCCTPLEAAVPRRGGGVAQHGMAAPRSTVPICSTRVSTGEHHRAVPRSSSASKTAACDPHSCHLGAFGE